MSSRGFEWVRNRHIETGGTPCTNANQVITVLATIDSIIIIAVNSSEICCNV